MKYETAMSFLGKRLAIVMSSNRRMIIGTVQAVAKSSDGRDFLTIDRPVDIYMLEHIVKYLLIESGDWQT